MNFTKKISLLSFIGAKVITLVDDGFLKEYPYGWYEDEELAIRMHKYGYKQGVSTKAWIHHEGAATIKYLWKKN